MPNEGAREGVKRQRWRNVDVVMELQYVEYDETSGVLGSGDPSLRGKKPLLC
jgi:hypothetical protein